MSPDVNNPGYRNVTFDELVENYIEATRGLIEGGADLILIETIFDTLNAKAAIFCRARCVRRMGVELPMMISGTITDASGVPCRARPPKRSGTRWPRRNLFRWA